jgi:hypothetical protein
MKSLVIIACLLINSLLTHGESQRDSIPVIHFQLVDVTNGVPISLGHVVSTKLRKGLVADMLGYFSLPLVKGDTLVITAIGYHQMRIPSLGQFSVDSLYYPIRLTPRIYEIKEVLITRFGTYGRFVREVAAMNLPKSELEKLQERLNDYMQRQILGMALVNTPTAAGGFMFGEDWFMQQKKKIEEKRVEERKWDIILGKFSAGIVAEITGLEGGDAIRFMEYCGFTEGYLLLASEYEVKVRVVNKFEAYKQSKQYSHESSR